MSEVVEHFGTSIDKPCSVGVLRRVIDPLTKLPGSYALLATHLTPVEHEESA